VSKTGTDWLAAREAADARSRSDELATAFARVLGPDDLVVDLGCGTGANWRYLDPFLVSSQKWLGIDQDSEMLNQMMARLPRGRFKFEKMNIVTDLRRVPAGNGVAVTASTFLDITSEDWLTQLADHCHDSPLLVAMSAAGQPEWDPVDELDEPIRSRIESHQRSDHGFGLSLGPDAAQCLSEQLRAVGCQVTLRQSDWKLGPQDYLLIEMMIGGVARRVENSNDRLDVRGWANLRRSQLQQNELSLVVKHLDLLSIPRRLVEHGSHSSVLSKASRKL
jgi:Methyltransferase domain